MEQAAKLLKAFASSAIVLHFFSLSTSAYPSTTGGGATGIGVQSSLRHAPQAAVAPLQGRRAGRLDGLSERSPQW